MLFTVLGAVLVGAGIAGFWYLLPRNGRVHPLVENSDIGSLITIGIMTVLTAGFGFLGAAFFG